MNVKAFACIKLNSKCRNLNYKTLEEWISHTHMLKDAFLASVSACSALVTQTLASSMSLYCVPSLLFQPWFFSDVLGVSEDHSRARTEALRSKQLGDFFSPVLHVTLGRGNVQVCQGFYELSPIHTRGWQPVYRKYKSRYFLYLSKQCWWISTESNMLMRQPRGLLHSGAVRLNDSPARPERATNWKVVGSGKKWESIDLKLDDLKEPKPEFVVVSMAGTELLRKSFQLHETVVTVKTTLSRTLKASWNRPADFIRLCLGSQALSNAKELGRLTIGAGTPLQAVLIPINCKHCMVSLEKQWYPCCRCSNCHQYLCLECGARCRECDYCVLVWFQEFVAVFLKHIRFVILLTNTQGLCKL